MENRKFEDVWEKQVPYLRSVISPNEETSPRFFAVSSLLLT